MKILQIEDFHAMIGKTIEFTDEVKKTEMQYAEPGMKAIFSKFRFNIYNSDLSDPRETVHEIWIDYAPFEEENHKKMEATYYDGNGTPCLTAVEAGWYSKFSDEYIGGAEEDLPFKVID